MSRREEDANSDAVSTSGIGKGSAPYC